MSKCVFVVTNTELGWDCVVGVFGANYITREQLEERFKEDSYIVFKLDVEESLVEYG